jgi:MFS family permease
MASTFSVDFRAHPAFGWWFANRLLFWSAFIVLNTFLLFFLIDVVAMPEAQAQRFMGQLSTLIGGALVVVALPSGWLADRIGRKPLLVGSGLVAAAGTAVLLVARQVPVLTLGAVVVGLGVGTFVSANWALITDIVPREEAARYLGIANIATAGGSGLARLLGATLIDPLNVARGPSVGYLTMYAIAAVFFLVSALVVIPLPAPKRKEMA